jgi:hypothetical protein
VRKGAEAKVTISVDGTEHKFTVSPTIDWVDSSSPEGANIVAVDLLFEGEAGILDEAKKQAEGYIEEGEPVKEKKKYNYKKKPGRKKKRGPKPGSRKKKEE